jgi:hypothetical protein
MFWSASQWNYTVLDNFGSVVYSASKASTADSPSGLTGWTIAVGTGQPTFAELPAAATTGTLGQSAIVTHSDSTMSEWVCVAVSPFAWLPRTAGIVWNDDDSEWGRLTFASGSLDLETLPDQ